MATTATAAPGKTSFVKEFLQGNPQANAKAVNEAWTGCRDERNDQSPHHQPSAEATGADRQSAWEDQERRQGKGSLQHAQDGNRYSRQDQLREGVPQRPIPKAPPKP